MLNTVHNTIIDNIIINNYSHCISRIDTEDINVLVNEISKELSNISRDQILNRLNVIRRYRQVFLNLKKLPFIKQRTPEWLDLRKDRLTASDLYDAIKGGSTTITLAKKKANVIKDKVNYNNIPALKWGTMFEPMATRCYSQANNNIQVHDFGLICDKYNKHFGASPDGINDLGIMIEIKCPYSRQIIDGYIPPKYQMQIQGQLAVCELHECDYIECDFKAFDNTEEYLADIFQESKTNHGIIAEYLMQTGEYYYLYSEPMLTPQEAIINIKKQIEEETSYSVSRIIPWKLNNINVQRVEFNFKEWQDILPKITQFWNQVEAFKLNPPLQEEKKIMFIDDDE